ncbi:MAG: PspC domain-containing protein [Woeseia sp.]|nr:PspC domain-containing protein [Woeseia sp.]NNE61724.1 PspC domain-containing protein [Woeseia sp.]
MSTTGRKAWERYSSLRQGLYRDRENGWIFGVCAGVADRYGFDKTVVRVIAVLALILLTVPTALAYLAATMLIRTRPLIYRGSNPEQEFWRHHAGSDHWSSL